jgi:hypothetical protein
MKLWQARQPRTTAILCRYLSLGTGVLKSTSPEKNGTPVQRQLSMAHFRAKKVSRFPTAF